MENITLLKNFLLCPLNTLFIFLEMMTTLPDIVQICQMEMMSFCNWIHFNLLIFLVIVIKSEPIIRFHSVKKFRMPVKKSTN